MGTTYQAHQLPSYDNHVVPAYSSELAQAGRAKAALGDAVRQAQYSRYPIQPYTLSSSVSSTTASGLSTQTHLRNNPSSGSTQYGSASRHSTRPSTPVSGGSTMASQIADGTSRRGSQAVAYNGLQIPKSISPNGGSISDFAAQVGPKLSPAFANFSTNFSGR